MWLKSKVCRRSFRSPLNINIFLQLTANCPDARLSISITSWSPNSPSEVESHRWLWLWRLRAFNHQRIIRAKGLRTTYLSQETHFLFILVSFWIPGSSDGKQLGWINAAVEERLVNSKIAFAIGGLVWRPGSATRTFVGFKRPSLKQLQWDQMWRSRIRFCVVWLNEWNNNINTLLKTALLVMNNNNHVVWLNGSWGRKRWAGLWLISLRLNWNEVSTPTQ